MTIKLLYSMVYIDAENDYDPLTLHKPNFLKPHLLLDFTSITFSLLL